MLNEFDGLSDVGRENRALACFGGNTQEIAISKLAERVGVLARGFAKANEINGFAIISRNRNDLGSSNFRRHLRPFAGLCRFFYFNDTRNGARRGQFGELVARDSRAGVLRDIASELSRPAVRAWN